MNLICNVKHFILSFFLIIGWIRNLIVLHAVVELETAKLGPTMFESDAIQPQTTNLNFEFFPTSEIIGLVQFLKPLFLHDEFFATI